MTDPPCQIDEHGFCARHRTHHVGRKLQLALADTEEGAKYRKLWDSHPVKQDGVCRFTGPTVRDEHGKAKRVPCPG